MSRAVVLGGGGPVGIGWESGLVVALGEAGVALGEADRIVGTSAGSVVGAQLALGMDLSATIGQAGVPLPTTGPDALAQGMAAAFTAAAEAAARGASRQETRVVLGRLAVEAPTVDEDTYLALFAAVEGQPWPSSYRCTAVEVTTGELKVWDAGDEVALVHAVASSCAIPGALPPVTIGGHRYMDGGTRTALNADLAEGHDRVVAISCFPLSLPEGFSDPVADAILGDQRAELARLRDSGARVEVVQPGQEFLDISGWGLNLLDTSRVADAFAAGRRQAGAELARLTSLWS